MKKFVIGNWKAQPKDLKEAIAIGKIIKLLPNTKNTTVVVAPPFLYTHEVKKLLPKKVLLGAQDISVSPVGAYTGEIPGEMLFNEKVAYVVIGHSERRANGETNNTIKSKIATAYKVGLIPVLCVGEKSRTNLQEALHEVREQLVDGLSGLSKSKTEKLIIAYEPVWAIGKNATRPSTPEECKEMVIYIRKVLSDIFGQSNAKQVPVLYGGSVTSTTVTAFIEEGRVQGFLVGRASLSKDFITIVTKTEATHAVN